jgi:hexosaminidase
MAFRSAALVSALALAAPAAAATQTELDSLAKSMAVRLEILDNKPAACPQQREGCFLSELSLKMPPELGSDLASGDFQIYFSSVAPIIEVDSDVFTVRLINGDLHVLEPRKGARIEPGKTYVLEVWTQGHFFSAFYPMPNMYLTSGKLQPRVIASTKPQIDLETGLESLPFVAPMLDEAKLATASADDQTRWMTAERTFAANAERAAPGAAADVIIVPTPTLVQRPAGSPIDLSQGVRLSTSGVEPGEIAIARAELARAGVRTGGSSGPQLTVRVGSGSAIKPEGYRLVANGNTITIDAADAAGASNALYSLAQQAAHEGGKLRPIVIEDAPRFGFRGLHVDLARNFHSKQEILKLVEQMGRYKLNKLHLHLGDDEGWRLRSTKLPELTEVGAYRCHDPSETRCLLPQLGAGPDRDTPVNGYLSQADYREILDASKARGIEVIPSFDMPGHSRAAIKSMEARYRKYMDLGRRAEAEEFRLAEPGDTTKYRSIQHYDDNTLNVCLDSTYKFLDVVIDELATLHNEAGTPLQTYHIGADETAGAWSESPACKALMAKTGRTPAQLGPMFIERVSASLAGKGIEVAGWSDGMGHTDPAKMPKAVQSNIWSDLFTSASAEAHRHANLGWKTILSVPNVLYFDIPYVPHPMERGYDWPSRQTEAFKVFSFIPENLPANASVMRDIKAKGTTVADKEPLQAGRGIAGMQAQIWSETVRSDAQVDYMLFPRLLAFAERAWHRAGWEPGYRAGASYSYGDNAVDLARLRADWSEFAAKMPKHLSQLERAGVAYRLSPPGARIVAGKLEANSEFPGQTIEYRIDDGGWTRYSAPVAVQGSVEVRTRSFDGSRASRSLTVGSN